MRFLITGHTGFKGAWLSLMLKKMGHEVSGLSLDPVAGSLYSLFDASSLYSHSLIGDIRSMHKVRQAMQIVNPQVVVHLAAQALVRESYRDPVNTYETNVNGTQVILKCLSELEHPPLALMITTDKVYANDGRRSGYKEDDELGGKDPYSSSKAIADLLIQAWQTMNPNLNIDIARAGNVIGGGDVSKERLLPDLIRAMIEGKPVELRNPSAIRPWQHVLDCLAGYLKLIDFMVQHHGTVGAWNFGPIPADIRTVSDVAEKVADAWGSKTTWLHSAEPAMPEAETLLLDSSKARSNLTWNDKLDFDASVEWTVNWHQRVNSGVSVRQAMEDDVDRFLQL